MPSNTKTKVKKAKARTSNETVKAERVQADDAKDEETTSPMPPPTAASKSKCKTRVKSNPKSSVKRRKSRPIVATKEKIAGGVSKQNEPTNVVVDPETRDKVMAVLAEALNPSGKSNKTNKTNKSHQAKVSKERMSTSNESITASASKGKAVCKKMRPKSKKSKPKSRPKSRGGQVMACKSSKTTCKTAQKTDPASKSSAKVALGEGQSQTNTSTQIIILGSPNDPEALALLQNLVKEINSKTATVASPQAKEQPATTMVTEQNQLEELYDAMYDLTNNVRTIQDSYETIIKSLVNLQRRRKGNKDKHSLIPLSASQTQAVAGSIEPMETGALDNTPGNIDRFMDTSTRNQAFAELFGRVDALKKEMAPFWACFDEGGYFDANKYAEHQISTKQRDTWLTDIRALAATVSALLTEYNKEVLDMFRISAVDSNTGKENK